MGTKTSIKSKEVKTGFNIVTKGGVQGKINHIVKDGRKHTMYFEGGESVTLDALATVEMIESDANAECHTPVDVKPKAPGSVLIGNANISSATRGGHASQKQRLRDFVLCLIDGVADGSVSTERASHDFETYLRSLQVVSGEKQQAKGKSKRSERFIVDSNGLEDILNKVKSDKHLTMVEVVVGEFSPEVARFRDTRSNLVYMIYANTSKTGTFVIPKNTRRVLGIES